MQSDVLSYLNRILTQTNVQTFSDAIKKILFPEISDEIYLKNVSSCKY